MRKPHHIMVLLAVCCLLPMLALGQGSVLRLAPYNVSLTFLNDQIAGDTLANGARVDSSRIYVLQRGGIYLANNVTTNTGWKLTLVGQDSTGPRPIIFLDNNPVTNRPPGQFISVRGDVRIKNLVISGYFEPDPTYLGGLQGALLTMAAAGFSIEIDSCILTNTNGNHVRTDQAPKVVRVTNSIFANMGYLGRSNLGAGKGIDVRAGSVDSLIVINSTFVNSQDRIIRHFASTAPIKYMRFEHNTVVNNMGYHGTLSLGKVGYKMQISNNLWVDVFCLGNDTDATRQLEFTDSQELDQFGSPRMTWIFSDPNDSTQWVVRNNYYSVSAAGQNFLTTNNLTIASPLTWHINSRLGADSVNAFTKVDVPLGNMPGVMTAMMEWYRRPLVDSGAGKSKSTTYWKAAYDFDRRGFKYLTDTLDGSYSTALSAYTGADGGYPVGDLNWFPTKLAQWLKDPVSDVPEKSTIPDVFTLSQNYPNPFNPSTRITYGVPRDVHVTLEVFDILGRKVATLVNERMAAGEYTATFDASRLGSGVYIYRLSTGSQSQTRKMMLMK